MSEAIKRRCDCCGIERKITVSWEQEYGELGGGLLSSWPIFELDPPCPGPSDTGEEPQPDLCPFSRYFGDIHPEQEIVEALSGKQRAEQILRRAKPYLKVIAANDINGYSESDPGLYEEVCVILDRKR